jgi:1,4-alpha-glucan branching enzyme
MIGQNSACETVTKTMEGRSYAGCGLYEAHVGTFNPGV